MIQNETFKAEKASDNTWSIRYASNDVYVAWYKHLSYTTVQYMPIEHFPALHDICTKIQEYEAGAEITHKCKNVATGQHLHLLEKTGKYYVYLEDVYSESRCQKWDYDSKEDAEKGFWDKYSQISQQMFKIGGYS